MIPQPGDVVEVTAAASVQFAHGRGFRFRVISSAVLGSTPTGWAWLTGYQLDAEGDAVERREIFVEHDGLLPANNNTEKPAGRRTRNTGPAPIPQQRTATQKQAAR